LKIQLGKLGAVEEINQSLSMALNSLENEDVSAMNLLNQARKELDPIRDKDSELEQLIEAFNEKLLDLPGHN
jgi:DNA repair protein RecN (Recombination protein N)